MPERTSFSRQSAAAPASGSGVDSLTPALISAVLRSWPIVLLAVVAAAAVATYAATQKADSYSATASVYFNPETIAEEAIGNGGGFVADPDRRAVTNAQLIGLPGVATRAARILGPGYTTNGVRDSYTVDPSGQSDIINVTASNEEPSQAQAIANAVVQATVDQRADTLHQRAQEVARVVQGQVDRLTKAQRASTSGQALISRLVDVQVAARAPGGDAEFAQRARLPTDPATSSPIKYGILGALFGLIIGTVLALLRARLDPRISTERELLGLWDLPVLVSIPQRGRLSKGFGLNSVWAILGPMSLARTALRYAAHGAPAQVVGVVSAVPGEGKTTVGWGLAAAAAAEGERVLLIEADLRVPTLVKAWEVENSAGTVGYLGGTASLPEVIRSSGTRDGVEFDVIPAGTTGGAKGTPHGSPLPLLRRPEAERLFREVRGQYDLVVVDLPPATLVPDALSMAQHLDGLVVVARVRKVSPSAYTRLRDLCGDVDTPVFGLIANGTRAKKLAVYGPS